MDRFSFTAFRPARVVWLVPALVAAAMMGVWAQRAEAGSVPVAATPIGSPTWKPVDFQLFSANLGTAADGYAGFGATEAALLPPPNHVPNPTFGIGPGAPHAPPYDHEFDANAAAAGFVNRNVFTTTDLSGANGIYLAFLVVPAPGTTGSSPDFASGPIIPNSLFPFDVTAQTLKGGALFSSPTNYSIPPLDATLTPPFHVDGPSHFPNFYVDNQSFALDPSAPVAGNYAYEAKLVDTQGNGYAIVAPFTVSAAPLPAGAWLALPAIFVAAGATAVQRRRAVTAR